ncbi:E3 SUMO-protein ligase RanBP2 [Vanessa atalanta]|uniref:E3 SUMO-protein ligase RanBP2 n=1 Tax=Vanessa atalanta TaxID=42275 RepID=UPI001FCDDD5C|nr:E3 SUMO-protein ligase RanBP2 [Vanessa atalanta]
MYRNKKDVDKHVESLMFKLSPKDFTTRAYSVARLYYEVGDYGSCQKYVEQYLTQKSNNAAAHKLLGQAFQKLGEKENALEQYKTSFDIDPTQTCTILDVCELLADEDVVIDIGRAKFWCEKAESTFPKHPVTFRLREKLLAVADPDPEAVVKLLKSELEVRPKDAVLHARLLKHYVHHNKYKEAFDHSCSIELDKKLFSNNFAWYETLSEILKYNPLKTNDWLYQLLLLTVKERICNLSLTEIPSASTKSLMECNEHLYTYDQAIETIVKSGPSPGFGEFHTSLLKHHQGQLVFHVATYLLKKAKKEQINWRDAKKFSAPLMLLAWQTIPIDSKVNWLTHAPERQQNAVHRWYLEGSYRCSQSGHYLQSIAQDKSQILLDQISQLCSGSNWKDKLYEKIFALPEQLAKIKSSYLTSNVLNIPALRLPRKVEIQAYDDDAQREYPNSLHHFVWLLLNYKNYADFKCTLFDMLTSTMTSSGPESLNKMDVLAFLFSSALTAQKKRNKMNYMAIDKPTLPANITDLLCTLPQMKWWDCAYKLSQNELGMEFTDIRSTLSGGIEVVRCVDNPGLDPELLAILGRIFSELAKSTSNIEETINLKQRSYLYYSSAIPLLEKLKNKLIVKLPEKRMFDYTHEDLDSKEINNLLEESKIYVALHHLNEAEYEKVISLLSNLKSPKAYYHLSDTYKKIALEENKMAKSIDTEKKYIALLSKAKTFAFKALDKVKEGEIYNNKTLYSDIQELIEEIESHLNRIDPDISVAINDDMSDENISISEIGSTRFKTNTFRNTSSTPKQITKHYFNVNSTAYRTAQESQIFENTQTDQVFLERIEKQIKNLQKRDTSINDFMEQTRDWFDENRKLGSQIISTINSNIENTTEQFKLLKVSVDQVKEQIDECRKECKDVVELKKQIADLKKEVNKLKKTSSEQTIDESDLYNLDEDYRSNENTSNFGAHLPFTTPQVIPPYAQRLIPPFSVPPNPYQLYGQNLYNLYNQYSQFTQSSVPGAPPIFDPARAQMNYPGVYPTPDQMYLDAAHLVPTTLPSGPTAAPVPAVHNMHNAPTVPPVSMAAPPVAPKYKIVLDTKESSKSLPVNVVITSSDPVPTSTVTPAPVLSVTIPQKHIKNSPHNYQIQMPTSNDAKVVAPPVFHFPTSDAKTTVTTSSNASNWSTKSIFATSQSGTTLPIFNSTDTFKDLNNSKNVVDGVFSGLSPNTSLNKSRTLSEKSNTSIENYDPCPDFKPIIPLPAEVKVTTGEENETAIFSSRAKLFRFTDKQWKERGIGEMKLLKHNVTGKVRVLMRREQVHKICANHIILPEMEIKPMKNEAKAYFWVANDFAEETVILEKFCIRFKTADIAKDFFEAFESARKDSANQSSNSIDSKENISKNEKSVIIKTSTAPSRDDSMNVQTEKTVVGGFTFNSKPSFKSIENVITDTKTADNTAKVNVFSGLTFKTATSTPFQNILNIPKNLSDNSMQTTNKNITNVSQLNTSDSVEEFEPTTEFKPVIPLPALVDQKTGEENEKVLFEHRAKLLRFDATGKEWKERGLGNIKLLMNNDNNQKLRLLMRREQIMKVCCNHAVTKEMSFQKMPNMDKAVTWCAKDFSEGELVAETFCLRFKTVQACNDFIDAVKAAQLKIGDDAKAEKEEQNVSKQTSGGFGDKFKPQPGSWTCEACYTNNLQTFTKCPCCETPNPQVPKVIANNTISSTSDWGAKFKPKPGSWECKECLIRNEANLEYCNACNSPKDPNVKKDVKSVSENLPKFNFGIPSVNSSNTQENLNPSEPKFTFGIPQNYGVTKTVTSSEINTNASQKFSFGIAQNNAVTPGILPASVFSTQNVAKPENESSVKPINFSVKSTEEDNIVTTPIKPALLPTPKTTVASFGNKDSGTFQFSFKPKTQAKGKSPSKSPKDKHGDDSDDNDYASEDEGHHIHFSPVIPMPDKIEVVTGEENEEELYGHRAKLFIFTTGEWKERGIGIVKILKHKETGKLRVVMRREQVHKICLNYAVGLDNMYKPKDEKTWCFVANDFSEGEIMLQKFCLRFQNKDLALQFKDVIDKELKEKFGTIEGENKNDSKKDTDVDDVVFINEIQATKEEKQKAKELMLPENFYTYKNKEPCQGCRGCDEDDIKPESEKNTFKYHSKALPKQGLTITPLKTSAFNFSSPSNSIYGTPNNLDKTVDTTIFRTPLSTNGSNTTCSSPTTSISNVFGNDTIDKENTLTEKSLNPIKPVAFVSGNQAQSMSSVLAAPKLISVIPPADKGTATPKSVFGFPETKSIFGENKLGVSSTQSIFGFNAPNNKEEMQSADNKSIFAVDLKTGPPVSQGNKFGFAPSKPNQTSSGIFGSTGTFTFGNVTQPSQDTAKSIFGKAAAENPSIFSDKTDISSNKNVELKSNIDTTGKFTFGKNVILQNQNSSKPTITSLSMDKPVLPIENVQSVIKDSNIEKKDVKSIFEAQDTRKEKTPFKVDNSLTFAALSSSEPGFGIQKKTDFQWEGAGQQLFVSKSSEGDDKETLGGNGDANNSGAGAGTEEEYDPHYEPIVPLPDKIVVTTGEEDENKLFGERCKLYRYDEKSREWKERGVGEMKVLYHPEKNSYRLLLRREQVHKAVLNMLIFKDLELLPMKNSDRAWTWCGRNYAESAGEQETLAVRFKSVILATNFQEKVMECVRKLQVAAAEAIRKENEAKEKPFEGIAPLRLPKHLESDARSDIFLKTSQAQSGSKPETENSQDANNKISDVNKFEGSEIPKSSEVEVSKQVHFEKQQEEQEKYDEDYEHGYDHNEDSDGYYNEEEESSLYYPCKAVVKQDDMQTTCEVTCVQVSFDQELCSPKILVTDSNTGEILADMLIHTDTEFQLSEDSCTWTGLDYTNNASAEKTLTITFADSNTALEFYDSCETSKAATYASTDSES